MNKLAQRKEQIATSFCRWLCKRGVAGMLLMVRLSGATQCAHADTVYRCGDAYSSFAQCANGPAVEVKPRLDWATSSPSKARAAPQDLREAQALEKQRLQSEHQAAQTAPARLSTPNAEVTSAIHAASTPHRGQGKPHHRGTSSPYFTAKDPNAPAPKKATTKAVPATQAASHP